MEHKEAQTEVAAIIESAGFKVTVTGGYESVREEEGDAWRIVLEKQTRPDTSKPYARYEFEFYTGIAHRRASKTECMNIRRGWGVTCDESGNIGNAPTRAVYLNAVRAFEKVAKPVAPHIADLAYSWLLDGEAIDESFNDWCANFGSDPDSIKALNTYRACCETGEKLRKMFTREQLQALRDALQDY